MSLRISTWVLLSFAHVCVFAQGAFIPNAGQWNNHVLFRSDVRGGNAYLENDRVTFSFYNTAEILAIHDQLDSLKNAERQHEIESTKIHCYAYEVRFENSTAKDISGIEKQKATTSFFIGNDESKWKGGLAMYSGITYTSLYDGIDLVFRNKVSALKYDFILQPGADASVIRMTYNGQRSLAVSDGALMIGADFLTVREIIPAAFQFVDGKRVNIKCEYLLSGNTVSFRFPEGYDTSKELIIDPEVIASTHSGSTAMAFGFSATYDADGNIYASGVVYAQGYPVILGAYDGTYNGAHDIGVSKFDPTGANLLYCTYIGGIAEDYPLSMYEHQGSLYVYGRTHSADFPATAGAYDQTYDGMNDIVVFCLNSDASQLTASTFVGSIGDDGVNYITPLIFSDAFKGEIVLDAAGNVFIVSGSASSGFPVTPGAYSTTLAGGVDAVIFKMNSTLTTMLWSTFLGGNLHDSGMGIRVDESGNVFVVGSARNIFGTFPVVAGGYQTTYGGGASDVYIAKFDPTGSNLIACTFFGGAGVDLGCLIDIDVDGDVYVTGHYPQGVPVTSGVYVNAGSSNFVAKFNSSLSSLLMSTVVGDGGTSSVSLTSFMVDNCKRIYVGGFGGSADWPLTADALNSTWNLNTQWYLACMGENATSLLFGTLYGSWHCDGGTSRFDPDGIVYQAVCADSVEFPVAPWAYADGTNTTMWDICVFKIDFQIERDTANLPNVFTPNGDGINDVYDVGLSTANFYEVKIFDRWGAEVFSTNDLSVHWNGTRNNRECEEGVYYVLCRHGYCADEPFVTTGFVHLLRGK